MFISTVTVFFFFLNLTMYTAGNAQMIYDSAL